MSEDRVLVDGHYAQQGDIVQLSANGLQYDVLHTSRINGTLYLRSHIGKRLMQIPNGQVKYIYRVPGFVPVDNTVEYA